MVYSKILIIISSLVGVVGTVYAVLSILAMRIPNIHKSITLGGIDARDEELLLQREQARTGIPLVVIGWIGQSVFSLLEISTCCQFILALLFLTSSVILEAVVTKKMNVSFRKKYIAYKPKSEETSHKDDHSWGEF